MVCLSTGYSLLCDKLNDKRVLVTSYSWSIGGQTQRWRHHRLCFAFLYHIKQIDSMFPWVCAEKDHRRLQNVVRTSVTHLTAPRVHLPPPPHILTSSVNRRTATWNLVVDNWHERRDEFCLCEYTQMSMSTQESLWAHKGINGFAWVH